MSGVIKPAIRVEPERWPPPLIELISYFGKNFALESNYTMTIRLLECLAFIDQNEEFIRYAIHHKSDPSIYAYPADQQKSVLRCPNGIAFHMVGYTNPDEAVRDYRSLIDSVISHVSFLTAPGHEFYARTFIRKIKDSAVGCMEARFSDVLGFLADPQLIRARDIFHEFFDRHSHRADFAALTLSQVMPKILEEFKPYLGSKILSDGGELKDFTPDFIAQYLISVMGYSAAEPEEMGGGRGGLLDVAPEVDDLLPRAGDVPVVAPEFFMQEAPALLESKGPTQKRQRYASLEEVSIGIVEDFLKAHESIRPFDYVWIPKLLEAIAPDVGRSVAWISVVEILEARGWRSRDRLNVFIAKHGFVLVCSMRARGIFPGKDGVVSHERLDCLVPVVGLLKILLAKFPGIHTRNMQVNPVSWKHVFCLEPQEYQAYQAIVEAPRLIKNVRSDPNSLIFEFAQSVTHAADKSKEPRPPLRKIFGGHKTYTVDARGRLLRRDKAPMFSPEQKAFYSKHQSTSLTTEKKEIVVFGLVNFNSKQVAAGVGLDPQEALINRIFSQGCASYERPYEFNDRESPRFSSILFKTLEDLLNYLHRLPVDKIAKPNEVLARIRWDLESSVVHIFADNLESRALAQYYAAVLKEYAKVRAHKLMLPWSDEYNPPIIFYVPGSSRHLTAYLVEEQTRDRQYIAQKLSDPREREEVLMSQQYELFLLTPPGLILDRSTLEVLRDGAGYHVMWQAIKNSVEFGFRLDYLLALKRQRVSEGFWRVLAEAIRLYNPEACLNQAQALLKKYSDETLSRFNALWDYPALVDEILSFDFPQKLKELLCHQIFNALSNEMIHICRFGVAEKEQEVNFMNCFQKWKVEFQCQVWKVLEENALFDNEKGWNPLMIGGRFRPVILSYLLPLFQYFSEEYQFENWMKKDETTGRNALMFAVFYRPAAVKSMLFHIKQLPPYRQKMIFAQRDATGAHVLRLAAQSSPKNKAEKTEAIHELCVALVKEL